MSANSIFSDFFVVPKKCPEVENVFAKERKEGKPEWRPATFWKHSQADKNEFLDKNSKWTKNVSNDAKLLWNISVHVDIPAFEDYERMCLFNNHWSTTIDDLNLLRRNLKRGVKHSETGFLTFGGHWNPRKNKCEKENCFFGEGHKYEY